MKTKLCAVLLIGASLIGLAALSGCITGTTVTQNADGTYTTNTVKTLDTNRVDLVAKQAAIDGTAAALQQNPQWLPQFQLAVNDLNQLATSPSITLNNILTIVQTLPVKQLKNQTAALSFEGATLVISLLDVPQLPPQATADLQSVAKAIADGITQGIQQANIPPPPTTSTNTPVTSSAVSNAPAN